MQTFTLNSGAVLTLAAAIALMPSNANAQDITPDMTTDLECTAEVTPAQIEAGAQAVRVSVTFSEDIGDVTGVEQENAHGISIASPMDVPRAEMAAGDEVPTPIQMGDDETTWTEAESGPAGTDLWLHAGQMWLKSNGGGLMTSDEGIAWFDAPTALADQYAQVYPAAGGVHWLLAAEDARRLLMTSDQGRGASDITFNFPQTDNASICLSSFAATTRYAVAATQGGLFDAPGCTPGEDPNAGLYRFAFED